MNTLNFPFRILQLRFWNPTNALRPTISILPLNTPQAAQILVPPPFPLGDEGGIRYSLLQTPFVKVSADGGSLVEKIVDITGSLVMDLEDGPSTFYDSFTLMTFIFS